MSTATQVNFTVTKKEAAIIAKIVKRAIVAYSPDDPVSLSMDLTACHCNGTPLNLRKLLDAPLDTFGHDVRGISRYIDRSTGKLTQCFLPRCHA